MAGLRKYDPLDPVFKEDPEGGGSFLGDEGGGPNYLEPEAPIKDPTFYPEKPYSGGNLPRDDARSSEGPRTGGVGGGAVGGGYTSAPKKPSVPTPMAGSVSNVGGGVTGPVPFSPLPSPSIGVMATPKAAGLYGGLGGLRGGGLGVPLDPTSNAESDPISSLIMALRDRLGR